MKILVPLKRVADPDNANKIKVSADGTAITTEGLEWKMNPFDEWALEAALRLTEDAPAKKRVGEVVLVAIGPKDTINTIRQGLAMGAERAILVEGEDTDLDGNVVSQILKAVVEKEQPDLVVMGKQVVDGDSNVVGQQLAEHLGWPMATQAMKIATSDEGKTFAVDREIDGGVIKLKIEGPAVFTVADRILHPSAVKNGVTPDDFKYPESDGGRYASLPGIMKAKKKPVEEVTVDGLGVQASRATNYLKFELPPARSGETVFVETAEELVQKLQTEAKVI